MTYPSPPWPLHYSTGIVYATYIGDDGNPIVGSVSFIARAPIRTVVDDATIVVAVQIDVELDVNGSFSRHLPATDDPDVRPENFTWHVIENFSNGRDFDIAVPAGGAVNLLAVGPIQPSIGQVVYQGPPGIVSREVLARIPELMFVGAVTRDAYGAASAAAVVWPGDGQPGEYTADTMSALFHGYVDAWHVTYGSPTRLTYTQPAVTRDPTTGAITNWPAVVVS